MIFTRNYNKYTNQQKLIDACINNNKRAQLKLYDLYHKAMYNTCLNIVKDRYLAEDLMQDAFIAAFDKLNTFSGKVSFGAWLKRIMVNKCLDYLKKRKIEFDNIESLPEIPYTEDNEQEASEQSAEKIKTEINKLPDGYKTILTLHLIEGYEHAEIADILKISASTSRSQYSRAKALVIKNLKAK